MKQVASIVKRAKNKIETILDDTGYGSIGKKSTIIKPMRIIGKKRIYIGDNVTILNSARIETVRKWGDKELNGKLTIGDGTSIEQCCHLIAAKAVEIGKDCVLSAFVYISDCSHGYSPQTAIMQSELDIKPVKIGNHCFIGIGSCIMPGVELGDNVVIGANSVVTKSIPDNSMAAGTPAKVIKKYNPTNDSWE